MKSFYSHNILIIILVLNVICLVNGKVIPELNPKKEERKKISFTCFSKCDGQGLLCESVATKFDEKSVCLHNRLRCIWRCNDNDDKKTETEMSKKTIRKLGRYYTIEENISINREWSGKLTRDGLYHCVLYLSFDRIIKIFTKLISQA